jgi:N-acyl-L-homoserine lactone synthetase
MELNTQHRAGFPATWSTGRMPWPGSEDLNATVLSTAGERLLVSHLRQQADVQTEYEVDPGLASLEDFKDELGVVMAIMRGAEPIGTIRFIPAGHGVTLTERFWSRASAGTVLVGPDSWEVGRLIMAPEHRNADLLPRCMMLAFLELLQHASVQHMHASCHMRMTRLFRRFGFKIHTTCTTGSGKDCALIHGEVNAVANALKVAVPDMAHSQRAMLYA